MTRYDLIRKVEKIRDELNHYNFLFIDMKDANPVERLSRNWSFYSHCKNECKTYQTEINKFYKVLICNTIRVSELDDVVNWQIWWENIASGFNDIRNAIKHHIHIL